MKGEVADQGYWAPGRERPPARGRSGGTRPRTARGNAVRGPNDQVPITKDLLRRARGTAGGPPILPARVSDHASGTARPAQGSGQPRCKRCVGVRRLGATGARWVDLVGQQVDGLFHLHLQDGRIAEPGARDCCASLRLL